MTKKELLRRIEELERKVAKLEIEKQAITITTPIFPEPPAPRPWIYETDRTAPAPRFWGFTTSGG